MIESYIEALKNGRGYGWICEHGHELSKDELVNIIKEFDFAVGYIKVFATANEIYSDVIEELESIYLEVE